MIIENFEISDESEQFRKAGVLFPSKSNLTLSIGAARCLTKKLDLLPD